MQRLRELLAHGGIAVLAVVFALAFAVYYFISALAQIVISILEQHLGDDESAAFEFRVFDTDIYLDGVVLGALTVALIAAALFGTWRLTQANSRLCPECLSEVPRNASVCRFCTAEIVGTEP